MQDLSGKIFGPYTIKKKLGQGGMGSVYLAHQSTMDRDVAIKVLPVVLAQDSSYLERFRREAKMVANLEHARILPVHDYGEQDGISYIVMRYLKAGTLAERIRSGKIPLPEIVHIMTQVAQGLDYAHAKGVIHRDVKPANIMLDPNGDVVISDFGLSRLIEDSAHLTGSAIMGTPEYIAPEQGMDGEVDHRSDIYSLGVVLYEMLTGKVPFTGKSSMVVIVKHINETFPDPSKIAPDIPPAVANVVLKATAKDPNERYQSGKQLVDALNDAASGAVKASPRRSTSSPRWLIPALVGAIAVLLFALVAPLISPLAASPALTLTATAEPPTVTLAAVTPSVPATPLVLKPEDMAPILEIESGLITCAGSTKPRLAFDFKPDRPDGSQVFSGDLSGIYNNGETVTIDPMPFGAPGVPLRIGPPLTNTDILVTVKWPAGTTGAGLRLFVESDPTGKIRSYSAGIDPQGGLLILMEEDKMQDSMPMTSYLFDGELHTLRLIALGGNVTFSVDGDQLLTFQDPSPPPAGIVVLHVGGAPVELDMIAVCGSS